MFTGGVGRHAQGKLPIAKDYMGDPSSKTVREGGSVTRLDDKTRVREKKAAAGSSSNVMRCAGRAGRLFFFCGGVLVS